MAARNVAPVIELEPAEREQLESFSRSRTLSHALVIRAQIVLRAAEGEGNIPIARSLKTTRETVGKWRKRFAERRLEGLYDELRPGRPRTIEEDRIMQLVEKTLKRKPRGGTHWSCRTMAKEIGVSKSMVHRVWTTLGLQPHRQRSFKLSNDPLFVEKVRDIVGLCSATIRIP
jgi:transposase